MTEQATPKRQGTMAPLIAAVAVVLVIVATVAFWPNDKKKLQSMACPKTFPAGSATWVPTKAGTSDPGKSLAPSGLPEKAVVCGYVHTSTGASNGIRLTGSTSLHGDPRAVVTTLRDVPAGAGPGCRLDARSTDADRYLLALSYTGQVIWVSIPRDHCVGTSNGAFKGSTNLSADAIQALQNGIWPTDPTLTKACDSADPLAAAPATLPTSVSAVTVCLQRRDKLTHAYRYTSLDPDIVTSYNQLATVNIQQVRPRQPCPTATTGTLTAIVKGTDGKTRVISGTSTCLNASGGVQLTGSQAAQEYAEFVGVVDR